ncbi:hypothetical protein [Pseudomonas sp. NFR16]|uniref:hypothetical protein n=1 Tax=Pseudomonas sp. NFR16 TaxID=1566248 RepID=UPI0008D13C53|nr:hypothetical protein [Pseudomonas sp. NFR16]SEJ49316.1 hypothetical protein SAMN03159495_3428 [Pseudomonas sp. NFR16]
MRILIGALAIALLSGCVGTGDLERNDPSIAAITTKDPKRYALCVFPKWQNARTDASMTETENGYRLLVASNNMADEMLDVVKTAKGSSVVLRQRMAWSMMPGRSAVESAVRSCL